MSEIDHLPVLPDKLGKVLTHYFFRDSVSEPEIAHARPLLYPDPRPEPAARRAANPSIERERDAHLHPAFTSSDALRGVLRRSDRGDLTLPFHTT